MKTNTHPAGNWLLATKNYALLFVLILTISTSIFGEEPPEQQWVARYNGTANDFDYAVALAEDDSGNVYVTGVSTGSGTGLDYATVKYSPDGNQLWVARFNGTANTDDAAYALDVDISGNVYVTGYSTQSSSYKDFATIKYSPDGNQLWVAMYNGTGNYNDTAYALAVDSSGNVYVTGPSYGIGSNEDYATVKYSPDGNQLWVARYNGPANSIDCPQDIAVDDYGNVSVTGWSFGSGTGSDYATIQYDPYGNELWVKRYNVSSDDHARALALDISGNVYVTGYSYSPSTGNDYATIAYSGYDGNQMWVARYNGPWGSDDAYALTVDNSYNVYVTGQSYSTNGYTDYATVKYGPGGDQLWVARYNGPGNNSDRAYALATDSGGNIYVTGYSTGSGTGEDYATVKYSPDGNQIWVARYNGPNNGNDEARALTVDNSGNVYVAGGGLFSGADYATIKYKLQPSYICVDVNAPGSNNGSSWANAYHYLQDALTTARYGDSIWVAAGTYKPDQDTNHPGGTGSRTATFQLKDGVAIYGGFPNGGGELANRDFDGYETILSGDLGVADNNSDNSYHVVTAYINNSSAILDGFTITAGNADSVSSPNNEGSGMYNFAGSPTVDNCIFKNNEVLFAGAGLYNFGGNPTMTNCIFSSNHASNGGGVWNESSSAVFINCFFIGNFASMTGGGMENYYSDATVINCAFSGNSSKKGGAMYYYDCEPVVTNCTFSSNSAVNYGGGIYTYSSRPVITNCILWSNTAPTGAQIYSNSPLDVNYCDVQGGWTGTCNINSNPLFVDADGFDNILGTADDDLRMLSGSSCIDAGNNNAVPGGIVTDLDGRSRFFNDPATGDTGNGTPPIVDIGAYEYRPIIYVDFSATGANNGTSWANAYKYLQNALWSATSGYEIWVAAGWYLPDRDTSHPSGTNDRTATFQLINNVAIYGGFPSGGGTWARRNLLLCQPLLSGDLDWDDDYVDDPCNLLTEPTRAENSYSVVTGSYTDATAVLDGFTIKAGNANSGGWPGNFGGGMFNSNANCTVNNCTFAENSSGNVGGAIFGNQSDLHISNCIFNRNAAEIGGGGINFYQSNHPMLVNCSFISNKGFGAGNNAGGLYNNESSPELINCSFINNSAQHGGGLSNIFGSSPTITNCLFSGNSAVSGGGGMNNCCLSSPTLTDCIFRGNSADFGGGVYSAGTSVINVGAGGSISTSDDFYISQYSQIKGTGGMVIGLGGELIIDSNAVVDLNDPCDPNVKGTIQCDGLIKVKDNARLSNADVNVSRQAGGYFGKFEVEGSAQATNLDIHTDGDRFMDVNSSTFTGTIANNRIYVTITEGQNGSTEGILEVRGRELPSHPCDFNEPNVRVCQIDDDNMPAFDTNSWTLERLEIAAGAKVTLMNRFSSGNDPEVSYAKNLVLGAGCVLNVGTEHLFYTNLTGDSNSINRAAQLGFSLDEIDCDSNAEFQSRVGNNNYIDPVDPCLNRIQVERVTGISPDPNGMMKMSNFKNEDGNVIYARAKAKFAPCSEDKIRIKFNYMFNTSDPCAQIVVYLSDVAELLEPNDPSREYHYIEVSRILNPSYPLPGSAGSGRFGDFDMYVEKGALDLSQGTWVELELREPATSGLFARSYNKNMDATESEQLYIDNWDAQVSCYSCGICLDLDSDCKVLPADFLIVVSGTGSANTPTCVEGGFSNDGYTDSYDTPSWDWILNDKDNDQYEREDPTRCGEVPLSGGGGFHASSSNNPLSLTGLNNVLISGKRGDDNNDIKMKDRLYVFDSSYGYKQYIGLEPNDRCNIRIVRGQGSDLYQINSEKGVLRLDTGAQIVPPSQIPCDINEPRYKQPAEVYAGIGGTDSAPYGRPILDAAFDADANFVYVVPVVVVPNDNIPYAAAAKIQLNPLPRHVVKLYDGNVLTNDNQLEFRNSLREIEVDSAGNVYVTNANKMNASDILWKFEPNGLVRRLDLYPGDPCSPRVRAPAGMCVSSAKNMLYIASSLRGEANPNSTVIQGFSTATLAPARTITVSGMHHVTSIAEDPVSNALWVAGFNLNSNHAPKTFYDPYLAKVPLGNDDVNALCMLGADDLAMPLSICWTGALQAPPKLCGGADLNGNGTVNLKDLAILARHWLNSNCGAPNNPCEGADLEPVTTPDGDVDLKDLDILATYWLNTNCL